MKSSNQRRNAWISYLDQTPWTHFVTLGFSSMDHTGLSLSAYPSDQRNQYLLKRANQYVFHLQMRFRKKAGQNLTHFGVPETLSKGRCPTHFHLHILFRFDDRESHLFKKFGRSEWEKLNRFGQGGFHVEPIREERNPLLRYLTKDIESEYLFLGDLPQ